MKHDLVSWFNSYHKKWRNGSIMQWYEDKKEKKRGYKKASNIKLYSGVIWKAYVKEGAKKYQEIINKVIKEREEQTIRNNRGSGHSNSDGGV